MEIFRAFLPPSSGRRVQVSAADILGGAGLPGALGQWGDLVKQAAPECVCVSVPRVGLGLMEYDSDAGSVSVDQKLKAKSS